MPRTSSAKKALRQSITRRSHNAAFKLKLKRAVKAATNESLSTTVSLIDKAVKRQLLHQNTASRMKARLNRTLGQAPAKAKTASAVKPKKTKAATK